MVTSAMVISKEMRDAGWSLHQALHDANFPFTAMFWAEFDEEDWRIFLATPLPNPQNPENPYQRLIPILDSLSVNGERVLEGDDLYLIRPEARIVSELRRRYGTETGDRRGVRRISLSPSEAYVYEIKAEDAASQTEVLAKNAPVLAGAV